MDFEHVLITSLFSLMALFTGSHAAEYRRVCYYTNWAQYRPGIGRYTADNIEPKLCTHLIYAFAKLANNELTTLEWNDVQMYKKFNGLKSESPGLKTLIAVGGWNAGSKEFTKTVSTKAARTQFVQSTLKFLRMYGFDGLDLDWEYPTERGGSPADKRRFVLFVQELKHAFVKENFVLSAAVPAGKSHIDAGYDVPNIAQHLDFINLMTYDLHGSWETITGENSPLYPRSSESQEQKWLNMKWAAEYWVAKGAPKHKLNIGMAMYGRSFTLTNQQQNRVGAPTSGAGKAGQWTREAGFLAYYEICKMQDANQGNTYWQTEQVVPYYTSGKLWVGFDNQRSIAAKSRWLMKEGYGGAMIWSLALDDFRKECRSSARPYPLLTTIYTLLTSLPPPTPTKTTKHTTLTSSSTTTAKTTTTTHFSFGFSCANRADGFYVDQDDCSRFYRCVGGQAYHYSCPSGLQFNPEIGACDWPHNVQCKNEDLENVDGFIRVGLQ